MLDRFFYLLQKYPLDFVTDLIVIVPILVGIINLKYLSKSIKIILTYLSFIIIINIISIYLGIVKKNNMFLFNIKDIGEIIAWGLFYFFILKTSNIKSKVILILAIISLIINILLFNNKEISGYSHVINSIVLIIAVFLHYHEIVSQLKIENIIFHSPFWLSASILLSSSGTILIYLFSSITLSTTTPYKIFDNFLIVTQIVSIISLFLITFAFWINRFENKK